MNVVTLVTLVPQVGPQRDIYIDYSILYFYSQKIIIRYRISKLTIFGHWTHLGFDTIFALRKEGDMHVNYVKSRLHGID